MRHAQHCDFESEGTQVQQLLRMEFDVREFVFQLSSDTIHHCPCVCGYQLYPCPPPTPWAIAGIQWGHTREFTEYCVPADPGPTPDLHGEIFPSIGLDIYFPGMSIYAGPLTKGARGYGAGTYPGIYKKYVPHSTRGCTLDITKHKIESPGKSPLSLGSGGPGLQLIAALYLHSSDFSKQNYNSL